jgi:uncharacterized protein YeaO (DUF488 family)
MPDTDRKRLKILIKRAYEDATPEDGYRVLVDRVWPRGRSKEVLKLDQWARDLAPSADLRKWFGHDPQRWDAFQHRYRGELDAPEQQERLRQLLVEAGDGAITLVYGAKDEQHNQAIVLRDVLSQQRSI